MVAQPIFSMDESGETVHTVQSASVRRAVELLKLQHQMWCARSAEDYSNISASDVCRRPVTVAAQLARLGQEIAVHPRVLAPRRLTQSLTEILGQGRFSLVELHRSFVGSLKP